MRGISTKAAEPRAGAEGLRLCGWDREVVLRDRAAEHHTMR
ncbi:hypothetical protein [Streptomyces bluensis]